ncbi:MAG: RimK family alpha-L-glutamate ligase [Halobacteriaceae archaeon]
MQTLAVANRTETFERMQSPLADRGIEVVHVPYHEQVLDLTDPPYDADRFDVGYVYPGRVMEGGVVDAVLEVPWVNDRSAVLTSRNKAEVLARLDRAGLPVPASIQVSNPVDEDAVATAFETFEAPVVVKPNSTTRGVGVAKAHDLDSLLGIVDYLNLVHDYRATGDKSYLIQEYLPEATDYRVMVLDGEYVGAVERRLPAGEDRWKHNVHRGAEARGVDLPAEYRRLAERVATTLDIRFVGVDLLATADRVVVNETNARPTIDAATKYEPDFYDRLAGVIDAVATGD